MMSERTCHNCGSRHDCSAYKHGFVGEDATCWRAEGQGRCPLTLVVKPDGSGALAACRVAELEQQLTAERTRAEQAEADNAALMEGLEAIKGFATRKADHYTADFLDELLERVVGMASMILSQPHPGDAIREELERLRADAAMRDPFSLYIGKCGHIWNIRKSGEECPTCREIVQAQTEAWEVRGMLTRCEIDLAHIKRVLLLTLQRPASEIVQEIEGAYHTASLLLDALNAGKEDGSHAK
jgi:hypothetical protein